MKLEDVKKDDVKIETPVITDGEITNISGIESTAENFESYVEAVKFIKDTNPQLYAKIMNWD